MNIRLLTGAALLLAFAGCQTYDIVQKNIFSDEDGRLVVVQYGRSDSEHTNTFVAPNGKEMDFKSRLVVKVTLPNGDDFTAWQCMNYMPSGTMYKTDNRKWMTLVNGFSVFVYTQQDDGRYFEVYRGVLCDTPQTEVKKDERWHIIKPKEKVYRENARTSGQAESAR